MNCRAVHTGICAVFSLTVPGSAGAVEWQNITNELLRNVPGYRDGQQWWNKRLGKVHADSVTGDVYVSLCEGWGTYRSSDQGQTWALVDNKVALGRHVGDLGVFPNPATGDFILFKVNGGRNANGSAVVLERGRKLLPIRNIGDGWNSAMADWSQTPPRTLLARQHHSKPKATWLSTDGGRSWEKIAEGYQYAAMLDANTVFLASPYYLLDGKKLSWDQVRMLKGPARRKARKLADIMLTRDQGKTMTKVAEFAPAGVVAARWGEDLFWLCSEGVMVTRDRGKTWELMGKPVKEPILGPYFGRNKETMVVVSKAGWFKTVDAGKIWAKLAEFWYPDEEGAQQHTGNLRASWDPVGNVLYIGLLGKDAYRRRLSAGGRDSAGARRQ